MKTIGCKQWICLLGLVGALGGAGTCGAQTANPVRLGWIGPLTGASADFGIPMLNGAKLAVDEINAAGGYLGRPLELIIKDDTANPEVGL